uniref:Calmodulin-binding protein 60 A n=1 Tax=Triticum urartu TaxID=4572 RepID=A0A8R7PI13_TRIUA
MSQKRQPEERERPRWGGCGGGPAESGGSSSPADPKRQRVPALREVITEVMRKSSIEKLFSSIEPLIRRVVKEEIELALANHAAMMTSPTYTVPSTSKNLQLQFTTRLSLPIFTGSKVEGEGTLSIALVDTLTREVVVMGTESLLKVEIVVLEGDFEDGEGNDWTAQEFNNNIVKERQGKRPLLSGDVFVGLDKGIGTVGDVAFTDNSSWTRSRKFRLGARTEDGCYNGVRVREAKTESFVVKDHRGELYKKHHPPVLEDEVWRLEKIGKEGAFHKRLNKEKIVTVKDFLTLLHLDAPRLRKAEANAAVKQAFEDWKNVSTCDNETLLENPSQLLNMRSSSLCENEFFQLPAQVAADDFDLSHLDIPSGDIFSVEPLCALDPCAVGVVESSENRFQPELPPLGGHGQPQESLALDKFSNSLVFEESTSHASFNEEDYYCRPGPDPPVSFDTQDLGAALKGFIATISKPKPYRGWRTLSYVIGWIFYTKRMAAQKRKKPGK